MTNSPRQVRIDADDLALIENIKANRPTFHHDKDLKAVALKRGLRLLAAEATMEGPGQYGGLNKRQLARELRQMLLPVLDFLAEANELPSFASAAPAQQHPPAQQAGHVPPAAPQPAPAPETVNYERNTQDLKGVMMSLDDADDDDDDE
jgi:hypothetical protein